MINADALRVDALPEPPTAVVANLPYNVAVPVLLHLLATFHSWSHGLVMVQAEVADRLAASPGSKTYGVPSVKMAWYAAARGSARCRRRCSGRCPTSSLAWSRSTAARSQQTTATRDQVFAVVDAAFAQRRKMLRSALAGLAGSSAAASAAVVAAGLDPTARGETLDVTDFARIAEQIFQRRSITSHSWPHLRRRVRAGVRVRVPAKINLALKVGAPRADGYHPLATVYQAVSLYDEVHAAWADPDEFEVVVSGEGADLVPLDDSNLAVRAAKLLAARTDRTIRSGPACRSRNPSRWPAGWPAAPPTVRRRCWPARSCGTSTSPLRT